jgi:hydroxymethylglutaryl-CoA synthase
VSSCLRGEREPAMMKPHRPVGLAGYGVYIPRYRIAAKEIARVWDGAGLPVEAKSVPEGLTE